MDAIRELNWICKRSRTLHTNFSTLNQLGLYGQNFPGILTILSYTIPKVCTESRGLKQRDIRHKRSRMILFAEKLT